jgi:RNA polymerase sigma-70 factor (ECF subfamily)
VSDAGPQAQDAVSAGLDQLAAEAARARAAGNAGAARERFGELVLLSQRRASRLAYYYLRDAADAEEAVQDAFVKAFGNLGSYDPALPFEAWFTRILVNGCLDRLKARGRRARWMVGSIEASRPGEPGRDAVDADPGPEAELLRRERARQLSAAIAALPGRQREVVSLTQLDGRTTAEVSALTGLRESTVRVHLFRAMKRLRHLLRGTGESEG